MRSHAIVILVALITWGPIAATLFAAPADWTVVPLNTSADLYAVQNGYLPNHWVVGAGGFAARSNQDRTQWILQDPGTTASIYSVDEPTGSAIWFGAGEGVVRFWLYASWSERDLPVQEDFRLFATATSDVVAVGPNGAIFQGPPWVSVPSGTTLDLNAGTGHDPSRAWIVGDQGTILRTVDGSPWTAVASGTTADLHGVAELDQVHIYAVGDGGTILKSNDAGATWSPRSSGTTASLRAISISKQTATHLIAAGLGGTVLKSTDGGDTWCQLDAGTISDLYGAEAVSDSEYFVCGVGGLLLRTINGGGACGTTSVPASGDRLPGLDLAGPFPQPSKGVATFRVRTDEGQSIETDVFDMAGRVVLQLGTIGADSSGEQLIHVDARGLSPGVYIVRVRSGAREALRRLVITR